MAARAAELAFLVVEFVTATGTPAPVFTARITIGGRTGRGFIFAF
jgi:hypothetical protein